MSGISPTPPASLFPYGMPNDDATITQCDALIQALVRKVNERAQWLVWTVQSCEGHPYPMLEVVGDQGTVGILAGALLKATPCGYGLAVHPVQIERPWWRVRYTVIPPSLRLEDVATARRVLEAPWA